MAKAVRMADIAEKLGISVVSVSKAISGKDGVSAELREKILATAQEMGYRKLLGSDKQHSEWKTVGILVADRFFNESAFYYNLYKSLLSACKANGLITVLEIVTSEAERELAVPSMMDSGRIDGILFMGEFSDAYIRMGLDTGLPCVCLDFCKDSMTTTSVVSDNVRGGYIVTQHLLERGRRKIGFVGSRWATYSISERYLGYLKALHACGLQAREDWLLEDRDEEGLFIPLHLPDEMPDAFICTCDEVAFNLVETLKARGFRVPEDVAVTGYDNFRFADLSRPKLTTYEVNIQPMAEAAVELMRRKLQNEPNSAPIWVIPGRLIVREST